MCEKLLRIAYLGKYQCREPEHKKHTHCLRFIVQCKWEKVLFEFVCTLSNWKYWRVPNLLCRLIYWHYMYMYMLYVCATDGDRGYVYLHVQFQSACMYINMHICIVPVHNSKRRVQAYVFKHTTNKDIQWCYRNTVDMKSIKQIFLCLLVDAII